MLDVHEPIHDTGERRTWPEHDDPRGRARAGVQRVGRRRGQPAGARDDPVLHAHARGPDGLHAGHLRPPDRATAPDGRGGRTSRAIRTTLAKQLALYVVLYSPLQMAADLPENYEGKPAFQFIRDVAVDWDTTRVIDGEDRRLRGRRATGARAGRLVPRRHHRRGGAHVRRAALVPAGGRRYVAEIYADGPKANWLDNPLPVAISRRPVTSASAAPRRARARRRAGDPYSTREVIRSRP